MNRKATGGECCRKGIRNQPGKTDIRQLINIHIYINTDQISCPLPPPSLVRINTKVLDQATMRVEGRYRVRPVSAHVVP